MDYTNEIIAAVSKLQTLGNPASGPETLHVGFGFDANYARPMGVSLTSIAVNNPTTNIHAHLFSRLLGDEELVKLEALVEQHPHLGISLYEVNDTIVTTFPIRRDVSLAMYFRIMMPIVLTELDKLLYLDSDVFCLDDISGIMKIDMEGKTALVVSDIDSSTIRRIEALSLQSGQYFNSGVMMIDIKQWNAHKISEQFFYLNSKYLDKFVFVDQDQLNIALENKVKYMDKSWNFVLDKDDVTPAEVFSNIKLIHFANHPKPWKVHCTSPAQPLFLQYQRLSPWNEVFLEYPKTYKEARKYSELLYKKRRFKESLVWYKKYLMMKITHYLSPAFLANRRK
jgi:lipopolysaccharide biosynthesis glycosyltransferase